MSRLGFFTKFFLTYWLINKELEGAAAYKLGNTSSRTITEVKQH